MNQIDDIYSSIAVSGFSEDSLRKIDTLTNDILYGRKDFIGFTLSEHAGLCKGGAPLIGASVVVSYARRSLTAGGNAESSAGGNPANWQIDEKGVGMRYDASNLSDYIPNDLYFGADSMTVFMYKETSNERRTGSYIYDATNNCILSQAIDYMQMTDADSFSISFIERHGDRYYKSNYERMLPYELNARWNGSKPEKP